jgi:predicted phosphodiesterase
MKIAVFSDVHGNTIALDAVLGDIVAEGVDGYWVVGDFVALGPDPVGAVERLSALPNATFVRGNTDRYTLTGGPGGPPALESARQDLQRLEGYLGLLSCFVWARGAITGARYYDWLASVPLDARITLPDDTRVLLVHAAPGTDDGRGIEADMTDDELATALEGADADLVIVGHTHVPLDRTADAVRAHNLGSISRPETDETRAMWTLLTADESGYTLDRRFTIYDIAAVKAAFDEVHHPSASLLKGMFPTA